MLVSDRLSGRGTTRVEDAQGTPTQSHISPSILEYEDNPEAARAIQKQKEGTHEDKGTLTHQHASTQWTTKGFLSRNGLKVHYLIRKNPPYSYGIAYRGVYAISSSDYVQETPV